MSTRKRSATAALVSAAASLTVGVGTAGAVETTSYSATERFSFNRVSDGARVACTIDLYGSLNHVGNITIHTGTDPSGTSADCRESTVTNTVWYTDPAGRHIRHHAQGRSFSTAEFGPAETFDAARHFIWFDACECSVSYEPLGPAPK